MLYQLSYFRISLWPISGRRWIRTTEGINQQIYSLPHLATLVFALSPTVPARPAFLPGSGSAPLKAPCEALSDPCETYNAPLVARGSRLRISDNSFPGKLVPNAVCDCKGNTFFAILQICRPIFTFFAPFRAEKAGSCGIV